MTTVFQVDSFQEVSHQNSVGNPCLSSLRHVINPIWLPGYY